MRVKEIIIDGFKSYATRTVITDWDPQFNCITGLNGSGKSNILDAICFVLGITTLSAVRASNQQDLIYKRGQAGVTKASVSIVFDNEDKDKSPLEFKNVDTITVTRQVVLGGTSKYLVNGHRAQQNQVQQLFQSVQLNINNPNFLIMQGQITKVVNMRPREILALIEEAAGTGMYEKERIKAVKDINERDGPMKSTKALLVEEISPKLEELRHKKREFLEFQHCASNVEKLERMAVTGQYLGLESDLNTASDTAERRSSRIEELESLIASKERDIDLIGESLIRLRENLGTDNILPKLESQLQKTSEERASRQVIVEETQERLDENSNRRDEVTSSLQQKQRELDAYQSEVGEFKGQQEELKEAFRLGSEAIRSKRELLSGLETGISSTGERETGYAGAIKQARSVYTEVQEKLNVTRADYERKQASLVNLDELQANLARCQHDSDQVSGQMSHLETTLASNSEAAKHQTDLRRKQTRLRDEATKLRRDSEHLVADHPQLEIPSVPGVYGRLAHLIRIAPQHADKTLALEICTGSQLWNLIVDTDVTSAQILKNVKQRLVVIPLNRIMSSRIPVDKVVEITAEAGGNPGDVSCAVDLIDCDPEVRAAAEYAFGNTLICSTDKLAQHIAFKLGYRAVTLAGDLYDPRGTISGGYRPQNRGPSKFGLAEKHHRLLTGLQEIEVELQSLDKEIISLNEAAAIATQSLNELELAKHEFGLISKKVQEAEAQLADAQASHKSAHDLQQQCGQLERAIEEAQANLKQVESDAHDFAHNREEKLRQLQSELNVAQSQQSKLEAQIDANESHYRDIDSRLSQLKVAVENESTQAAELAASVVALTEEKEKILSDLRSLEQKEAETEQKVNNERARISSLSKELQAAEQNLSNGHKDIQEAKLEFQQLGHDRDRHSEHIASLRTSIEDLQQQYPWTISDRHLLGVAGSAYDLQGISTKEDVTHLNQTLIAEKKRLTSLQSKVNPAVVSMIERLERDEQDVRNKLQTIMEDKRKLEESISMLDARRQETINRVWREVSDNFGLILGDLLPQASAELVPIEPPIEHGFTLRVRLGNQWKEGLTELSGGQRSLVALSLILALLTYHPAPMYILDEVDAALDVHHTRNIGHIIKTRFKDSQFIVVSLKDDMFTNANRIYQARFQEGTSTVSILV